MLKPGEPLSSSLFIITLIGEQRYRQGVSDIVHGRMHVRVEIVASTPWRDETGTVGCDDSI